MIPTKLVLRNFMCYRDEVTLDLSTVRIACISGDNGAGKSSLLDAITWALWGRARAATERELISLGTTEMGVDFQFLLGRQEYRVLRRRRRRGASADLAQLEVQIRDVTPDGNSPWRPISGDTVAQSQRLLTAAVGMDYDTFINSAFILQGRADEFTTKGPTDRKQVLADILGLGRYDTLEERARALRREREAARREAERDIERTDAEVAGRPDHEAELAAVSAQLLATLGETERLAAALDAARARRAELEARELGAREAEARRDEHGREAEGLRGRIATTRERLERLAAIVADAAAIRAGHAELVATQERDATLNAALRRLNALERQQRAVEQQIDLARGRLQQEQHALEHQLGDDTLKQGQIPGLEGQHAALQRRLDATIALEERRATIRESVPSAKTEGARWRDENESLKREMKRIKDRQQQIDKAGAGCPLCRRPLGDDERHHIHEDYQAEGRQLGDRYRENGARIARLERELAAYAVELKELDAALGRPGQHRLAQEVGAVAGQLEEFRRVSARIPEVLKLRDGIAERIARNDFAHEAQAEQAELAAAIAALAYDPGDHARVREHVAALAPFDARLRDLQGAEGSIDDLQQRLAEDEAAFRRRELELAVETARAAELRAGIAELPALIGRCENLALDLEVQSRRQDELTRRHGALEEALRRIAEREEEGRRLRVERARLAEDEGLYRDLAKAFGKSGIQAMIIEAAVPELQDEANAILANMPGNGMRVEFRTQRETQKGETVEALDIVIGDEAGQRNYLLYSGGEAFRINFAIRVALSKLLVRRAGAKLQTLVIDEGFGTQDTRGRDGIVEAIRAIEGDFATILVITHVNELKEAFPTQILVEKGPSGSQITIN